MFVLNNLSKFMENNIVIDGGWRWRIMIVHYKTNVRKSLVRALFCYKTFGKLPEHLHQLGLFPPTLL